MESKDYPIDLKSLPSNPGVYKYYHEDTLIYVGKAKNIKKRVSSYFNKQNNHSQKTQKLVREISSIKFIIVDTEFDALLLENNLIKENQPKYNILLKDDKTFPYICISNERFPKIYATRRYRPNTGEFFGPYTSVKALNNILELITKLYTIRTCTYSLTKENVSAGKFKVCLEYHIGNCLGPCEGHQSEENYLNDIAHAKYIIQGHLKTAKDHFHTLMVNASESLAFEEAQSIKNKIELLDKFKSKTVIINNKLPPLDVITISSSDKKAFINYMRLDQGIINISESITVKTKLEETESQILEQTITSFRSKFNSSSNLILSNIPFDSWKENIEVVTPQIGDKKKLVELSLKNALYHKKEDIAKNVINENKKGRVVRLLQDDLKLQTPPNHIECFDNSNIQGTNPVASMVCFKNGKPSKKDYRHFKIKTIIGPDDFGSMKEIVYRRYKRLKEEDLPYPDLIIVDGGKGQLSASCESLKKLDLYTKIPIIGIAKRLEEIYYPEDSIPVHISKKSESLKLIQHLRDEAHRFAITFHRSLRSKGQVKSELDDIMGIGPKTRDILLYQFKSFLNIKNEDEQLLISLIGTAKTKIILDYIQKKGA